MEYFPGVESWFDRVDMFVKLIDPRIHVEHYIVSAGLKEILEGVSIHTHFKRIFASEYHFNHHDVAVFPKVLVTDSTKTQYLFRINKGKLELSETINTHMSESERPIPFEHIVYIGDGLTDVPSMTVTKKNGGHTLAVYKKGSPKGIKVCRDLLEAGRVDFIAPADYSPKTLLDHRVQLLLNSVVTRIQYEREVFRCRREHHLT